MTDFWTDKEAIPLQKYRFVVQVNLYAGTPSYEGEDFKITNIERFYIPKHLIKSVNLPELSLTIDNDAANIGGSQIMEGRDPVSTDLEIVLYMTPYLMRKIRNMMMTYYNSDLKNKMNLAAKPQVELQNESNILVKVLNPEGEIVKTLGFYQVIPVSYDLGDLEYGSSDVVEGNIKFHFNSTHDKAPAIEEGAPGPINPSPPVQDKVRSPDKKNENQPYRPLGRRE